MSEPLLEVVGLGKAFPIRGGLFGTLRGEVKAVTDISFKLTKGEVFGLAGESGSGIVDISGTTSDVGALHKGFPRQATVAVEVGGVRTNFRMPDVFSFGLGGGSLVVDGPAGVKVGPTSVGYKLTREALVFGGSTLTSTDFIVAAGRGHPGHHKNVAHLDKGLIARMEAKIADMLETAVERSRLSADPLPVSGGGSSILVQDKVGSLDVVKPHRFAVANAVGAAIAQVSGEIDRVYSLSALSQADAIEYARQKATAVAVAAGARAETIEVVEVEDGQCDARASEGGRRTPCRVVVMF